MRVDCISIIYMIKLSIITINYNNAEGLRKTLASVASQTYPYIEHIIVDGGSTDGSVEILKAYPQPLPKRKGDVQVDTYPHQNPAHKVVWVSEKDKGIYNAMNKGIEIALGKRVVNDDHTSSPIANCQSPIAQTDYIQILNSGDILAAPNVTEKMMVALQQARQKNNQQSKQCISNIVDNDIVGIVENNSMKGNIVGIVENNSMKDNIVDIVENDSMKDNIVGIVENDSTKDNIVGIVENDVIKNCPAIFYGNMLKKNSSGKLVGKSGYTEYSLRQFYSSTLNHDCAYIRKDLFEEYGLYDENLKIVSDWKWYLQAIGLGRVKPEYVDIDVTIFDDGGISETNLALRNKERRQVLEELLPPAVLWDYDTHAFEMEQMNRLRRWKLYPLVYFIERVCFKFEKWGILKR